MPGASSRAGAGATARAAVVVAGAGVGVAIWQTARDTRLPALRLADVKLTAISTQGDIVSPDGRDNHPLPTDALDISLVNTGEVADIVDNVSVRYESREFEACNAVGGSQLGYEAIYDVKLPPWDPSSESVVAGTASNDAARFTVEAGGSGRFAVTFGPPSWPADIYPRIITMQVGLHHYDNTIMDLGKYYIISPPSSMAYMLQDAERAREGDEGVAACLMRNVDFLDAFGAEAGTHSSAFDCYPKTIIAALTVAQMPDPCLAQIEVAAAASDLAVQPSTSAKPEMTVQPVSMQDASISKNLEPTEPAAALHLPEIAGGSATLVRAWSSKIDEIVAAKIAAVSEWEASIGCVGQAIPCNFPTSMETSWRGSTMADQFGSAVVISRYYARGAGVDQVDADSVTIDLSTGEELLLGDVLRSSEAVLTPLLREAVADGVELPDGGQCGAVLVERPPLDDWTLDADGITFWFDKYQLSAGMCGVTLATVQWESFSQFLTEKGRNLLAASTLEVSASY